MRPMQLRGAAEQWIKEGKGVVKWTRLPRRSFGANAVRLQTPPNQRVRRRRSSENLSGGCGVCETAGGQ